MLRQNTAVTLSLGPIVMAVDGTTVATSALNISASEIKISKAGAGLASKNDATVPVYDAGGNYLVTFNTTDTNTLGEFEIQIQKATALPFFKTYKIISQVSYDALVNGSNINAQVAQISAGIDIATNAFVGTRLATSGYTAPDNTGIANIYSRIGVPVSGSISQDIQNISTTVVAGVPANFLATSGTLQTGTNIAGSYTDTWTVNTTYWTTAPVTPAVGGFGLNQTLRFNVSSSRVSQISIVGRFQAGAARAVALWAYNYATSGYDSLSNAVTQMNTSTTDATFTYTLLPNHQDTTGNCIIRFTSTSTTVGDRLNIDQILVKAVAAGATANEIADAVWSHDVSDHLNHTEAGFFVSRPVIDTGTVLSVTGATITLSGFNSSVSGCYNGLNIEFHQEATQNYEIRKILNYVGNGVITLDRAPYRSLVGDFDAYILGNAFLTYSGEPQQTVLLDSSTRVVLSAGQPDYNIPSTIWSQPIVSGTFANNTAGERLFRVGKNVILEGTLPAQTSISANAVKLPSTASSTNGSYDPSTIQITNGTGAGQSRTIFQYTGATQTAWLDRDWKVQPDNTSEFQIIQNVGREEINEGLVTSAGALTIRLNSSASTITNNYMRQLIFIRSGTGQDQVRSILSYDGPSQTATLSEPWGIIPDASSCYVMLPNRVFADTIIEGQVGAGTISTTISASGGASMTGLVNTSNYYNGTWIKIIAGTGAGQTRLVTAYANATGVFTVTPAWATTPDATSWFRVVHQAESDLGMWRGTTPPTQTVAGRPDVGVVAMAANSIATGVIATNAIGNLALAAGSIRATNFATDTGLNIRSATAISAAATSIKLDASAKAVAEFYTGCTIVIVGGTLGIGQARLITAYGTDRTATIDRAWDETPTGTIVFTIMGTNAGGIKPILNIESTVINKVDNISATMATASALTTVDNEIGQIITKVDNISATQATSTQALGLSAMLIDMDNETDIIVTKVDNISATMAKEVSATANKTAILLQFPSISGDVNTILTSAHGGGAWDGISTAPVVLSASQPYYTPALQTTLLAVSATADNVNSKTTNLPVDPASNTFVATRLATSGYTAPDNLTIQNVYSLISAGATGDVAAMNVILLKFGFDVSNNVKAVEYATPASGVDFSITEKNSLNTSTPIVTGATVSGQVVLSGSQPFYTPALQTTLLAVSADQIAQTTTITTAITTSIKNIAKEVWNSAFQYVDTDGTTQTRRAWVMVQAIYGSLKQRMKNL